MEGLESDLVDMYANMVIQDEEEGGIVVAENEMVAPKQTYMLVGKFLTEKNINYNAMQNVMAGLWRPKEGMEVYEMGGARFSFVFFHKMDLQKVIDGGPWSFEQAMLVYNQVGEGEDPVTVKLQEVEMWVQIYDIPRGFLSETILKSIGSSIGRYIKSDPGTFEGGWKSYVRIRVLMNVEKPLKRRMKIKREGDNWSWLNFKYERLGTFCFVCGIIGHSDRDCNIVYANPEKVVEKAYGVWLRAPSRNVKNNTGARWLRNAGEGSGMWGKKTDRGGAATIVQGGTQGIERFMEVDGIIRQSAEDSEEISVKSRGDRGKLVEEIVKGNVVVDPKRKRVDEAIPGAENGWESGEDLNNQHQVGPKNLLVAGPGSQARQGP